MITISKLKNPVQKYAWGSTTAIQDILGKPAARGQPMAELWMGAHPKTPSRIIMEGELRSLDKVIETHPQEVLGERIAEAFSGRLPFLFKILAVSTPLSIQVHPDLEQAREGFAREQSRRIPLDAPARNYRDENHKPELLCALTHFEGLSGFRSIEEIIGLLKEIVSPELSEIVSRLKERPDAKGLQRFFKSLMKTDRDRRRLIVAQAADNAEKRSRENLLFRWIADLGRLYPEDPGILSPAFLNFVKLRPGEALYIPPGELHAYLNGVGIELMANSDNVLRGGLTKKNTDMGEVLRVARFRSTEVSRIRPVTEGDCEAFYPSPAKDFLLSVISLRKGVPYTSGRNRGVEILLCLEGGAEIMDLEGGVHFSLGGGESVLVPAVVSRYRLEGNARIYRASVPGD